MGLEAIYQKPNLSRALAGQRIYPNLLRNLAVTQPAQVWATDITYVPGAGRAWVSLRGPRLAQPLRARVRTVQHARRKLLRARRPAGHRAARRAGNLQHRPGLSVHVGRVPGPLAAPRGEVVDGRQRPVPHNVFVERLWRTVKSEEVYLKCYRSMVDAPAQLDQFFGFYNQRRPHSSLAAATPAETCRATRCVAIKQRPNAPKLKSKVFRAVPRS